MPIARRRPPPRPDRAPQAPYRPALPAVAALPTLTGPHLVLRQLAERDLPALYAVFSDPLVMRYWSHPPLASPADAAWYFANLEAGRRDRRFWQWGIAVRDEDTVIGTVSLFGADAARRRAELGYAIASARWRRGHASEAVHLAIAHAAGALGLRTLRADVDPRNLASRGLLETLGFRCTAQRHTGRCVDGVPVPSASYVLQMHMPDATHGRTGFADPVMEPADPER